MLSNYTFSPKFSLLSIVVTGVVCSAPFSFSQTGSAELASERAANSSTAYALLKSGEVAYYSGDYEKAVRDFSEGLNLVSPGSQAQVLRAELADRFATAASQQALSLRKVGELDEAKRLLDDALAPDVAPGHQDAQRVRDQLDDPIRTNVALTPEHVQNVDKVRRTLYLAEGAYNLGKFDEAREEYQNVLKVDPYNKAARRGLERVTQRQANYYRASYDSTRARMLENVDKQWELRDGIEIGKEVSEIVTSYNLDEAASVSGVPQKLETLIVPQVDFQGVDIFEAVDFLRAQSRSIDNLSFDEISRGVQFVLNIPDDSPALEKTISFSLSNVPLKKVVDTIASSVGVNVKVEEFAVVFISYDAQDTTLISRTFNVPPDFLTRSATEGGGSNEADPFAIEGNSGGSLLGARVTAREMLENMGVTFDGGATASYIPATSTLIVKNTQEQLDSITNIIAAIAKEQPTNIILEVKVVNIEQLNDEDLGVDWSVAGTIAGAYESGLALAGGSVGNGIDTGLLDGGRPLTAGNRTGDYARGVDSIDQAVNRVVGSNGKVLSSFDPFEFAVSPSTASSSDSISESGASTLESSINPAPGILSVSGVLGESTVAAMLRGLSQKKGTDFITTPSITTRSGQLASLQVGREFIYATEYEPPEVSDGAPIVRNFDDDVDNDGIDNPTWRIEWQPVPLLINRVIVNGVTYTNYASSVTPSHPTAFESVLLGSELDLEPTYDKETGVIDLAIKSTTRDFDGYINYGTPINTVSTVVDFTESFKTQNLAILTEPVPVGNSYWFIEGSDPFPPGPADLFDTIEVTQQFFEATPNYILMPVFQTINAQTNISIYDGATVILGGLLESVRTKVEDGTPILSKIPLIGEAFKANSEEMINKQVLIMVTAKVVDPTGSPLTPQY